MAAAVKAYADRATHVNPKPGSEEKVPETFRAAPADFLGPGL
jgi:hypothetical protein